MNVSLHLHRNEGATAQCSTLATGTACLSISSTKGEVSIFGTLEQLEDLHHKISLALYPGETDETDIHSEG